MATAKEGIKQKVRGWSHHDSADLYGIDDWGNGYFRISKKGEVTVRLNDEDGGKKDVSLCDLLEGLKERGTTVPVLFRFRDSGKQSRRRGTRVSTRAFTPSR